MRYIKYVETKLGKIGIVEKDNKIVKVIIINGSKERSKRNNILQHIDLIHNKI